MPPPLGAVAHLPEDVHDAIKFHSRQRPGKSKIFRQNKMKQAQKEEERREGDTPQWRGGFPDTQEQLQGGLNPPLPARVSQKFDLGGRPWLRQFRARS